MHTATLPKRYSVPAGLRRQHVMRCLARGQGVGRWRGLRWYGRSRWSVAHVPDSRE